MYFNQQHHHLAQSIITVLLNKHLSDERLVHGDFMLEIAGNR